MRFNKLIVFIIEDNELTSKLLQEEILKKFEGVSIFAFKCVEKALGNVDKNPDYIVLDHFLEGANGIDCIPIIKEFLPNAKIVLASSQNDILSFKNAYKYGAVTYFKKNVLLTMNVVSFIQQDIAESQEKLRNSGNSNYLNKLYQFIFRV